MNQRGSYWWNLLKGGDYFVATLFGIPAGIYISSYVAFKRIDTNHSIWWCFEVAINFIMQDKQHCINSLVKNQKEINKYYGVTNGTSDD